MVASHKKTAIYKQLERKLNRKLELRRIEKEVALGKMTYEEGEQRRKEIESEMINGITLNSVEDNETAKSLKKTAMKLLNTRAA